MAVVEVIAKMLGYTSQSNERILDRHVTLHKCAILRLTSHMRWTSRSYR